VERLLSHGSTGADDRAGQRAAQGRLRRADSYGPTIVSPVDDTPVVVS
jgi:hypothetical protein